jgi:predicted nucleic acid-binding protein
MLLDTSGLLCYYDRVDRRHQDAVTHFSSASSKVTQSYVIAEFVALCQARGINRAGVLAFLGELLQNPWIEVVWVDEDLNNSAVALLRQRLDKTHSLCDAVSFVLMKERGVDEALTTDHHFEQEGFRRLLP